MANDSALITGRPESLNRPSLPTSPSLLFFFEEWKLDRGEVTFAGDNKGDIVIRNKFWIDYEAVIISGVAISEGAIIGARALVTQEVPPHVVVGGLPVKVIKSRFDQETIQKLLEIRWWNGAHERIR